MNQNQCVPNWDLDHGRPSTIQPPPQLTTVTKSLTSHSHSASLSTGHDNTSLHDYEMAELAWENGQLTMHGLGLPRFQSKNNNIGGILESIVNQATHKLPLPLTPIIPTCEYDDDLVPLINPHTIHKPSDPTPLSMAPPMDALVPTSSTQDMAASKAMVGCSTRVGSCSAAGLGAPGHSDWSVSASGSDKWHGGKRGPEDTCEQLRSMTNNEMTSTSFGVSLDNTTRTVTFDDRDHDSVCHSKPQRDKVDEEDNQKKSTSSAKRRVAAVHNQSERKRRDKINQRMKTLQKLVPNSNKVDKASMLDEVIDYMKQLQSQIQVFNTMRLPQMMMPLALQQQQLQMSLMASMGMPMGMGMGMGLGMGMNMDQMNMNMNTAMAGPNIPGIPPSVLNPAAFMSLAAPRDIGDRVPTQPTTMVPTDPLSMYLASQSHSTTMDAYNRMTAMCQQLQQQQQQHQSLKHETNNR